MESRPLSATPLCPFCDGAEPELVGQWGGQMITAQWRCATCGSYFEAIRDSFDDGGAGERVQAGPASSSMPEK
jgi:hypothetical protein